MMLDGGISIICQNWTAKMARYDLELETPYLGAKFKPNTGLFRWRLDFYLGPKIITFAYIDRVYWVVFSRKEHLDRIKRGMMLDAQKMDAGEPVEDIFTA